MKTETCSRCGEEVRWGWRPSLTAPTRPGSGFWMHRDPETEHHVVLGQMMTAEQAAAYHDAEEAPTEIEPIPLPEVYSTPIDIGDPLLPGGAKQVMVLAAKHDWTSWATYSRGPRTHSTTGRLLSVSDFVVVRLRLDGTLRRAVGSWCDAKFDFSWTLTLDPDRNRYDSITASFAELKAWIKNEEETT